MAPIYVDGELKASASKSAAEAGIPLDPVTPMITGQTLPFFDHENPLADVLYGYDVIGTFEPSRRNHFTKFERFDEQQHDLSKNTSHGNQGKNRSFRDGQKKRGGN